MNAVAHSQSVATVEMRLTGDVQGLGIRPTIARFANSMQLQGFVRNCQQGVEISATGTWPALNQFQHRVATQFPEAQLHRETVNAARALRSGAIGTATAARFEILESDLDGIAQCAIPLDRVICKACVTECFSPEDRRYGYALNACAQCGPRYSIMHAMPFDRMRTSMANFSMCGQCRKEYVDPAHRRYHAQGNCCPNCGPRIWFENKADQVDFRRAVSAAANAIIGGSILALKGVGGYQLVCDATNHTAVQCLRDRKGRQAKPLAVMVESLTTAKCLAEINSTEQTALESAAGPIVILQANASSPLAKNIHPGLNQVGLMLPTSALHALLLDEAKVPLVVTSGNCEGEPLEYIESEATQRLASLADCFLHHDRPIVRPLDDSVVRCMSGKIATIRAARGIAPLLLHQSKSGELRQSGVALGGHQKTAVALCNGRVAFLGPHIGDLDSLGSRQRFAAQTDALMDLVGMRPSFVASDTHPDFFTTQFAVGLGKRHKLPDTQIEATQHHHAHVVAAMFEHGWLEREVLGFAFDGTGLGTDGTIWGGEVLRASISEFTRVAHLRPFRLVGGDTAVREPWRAAVALISDAFGEQHFVDHLSEELSDQWGIGTDLLRDVSKLCQRESYAISTTSLGRLFDAIAAIACGHTHSTFEGEAAMRIESVCEFEHQEQYAFLCSDSDPCELDWRPVVVELISDWQAGLPMGRIATKFHRAVANCIFRVAERFPQMPIVLTGGVFQNRVLVEMVQELFASHASPIALPGRIPVNDGGLAAGQLGIAIARNGGRL